MGEKIAGRSVRYTLNVGETESEVCHLRTSFKPGGKRTRASGLVFDSDSSQSITLKLHLQPDANGGFYRLVDGTGTQASLRVQGGTMIHMNSQGDMSSAFAFKFSTSDTLLQPLHFYITYTLPV